MNLFRLPLFYRPLSFSFINGRTIEIKKTRDYNRILVACFFTAVYNYFLLVNYGRKGKGDEGQ